MKLRVARHTSDLTSIINFYTKIIGLNIIGEFKDHAGYNGVFIGRDDLDWHLEFTTSGDIPHHYADEDDLLVFYTSSIDEYNDIKARSAANNIQEVPAKNPYWNENGFTLVDPDGFRVVISPLLALK